MCAGVVDEDCELCVVSVRDLVRLLAGVRHRRSPDGLASPIRSLAQSIDHRCLTSCSRHPPQLRPRRRCVRTVTARDTAHASRDPCPAHRSVQPCPLTRGRSPPPAPDSHHCPRSHPDPHSCAPGPVVEPRPAHVRPGVRGSDGRTPAPARSPSFLPSFLSTPPRRASSIHSGLRASPPLFVFVFVFCSFSFSGRACAVRARCSSVAGPGAPDGGRVGIWKP